MVEDTLESGEATAESTGFEDELDLGDLETAGFTLQEHEHVRITCTDEAYLENVTAEVFTVLNLQRYPLALLSNRGSRLDFIVPVATKLAVDRHDEDIL